MGRSACGTCMLVSAVILGPIVMVLLAVSFATDHWLEFDVDVDDLSTTVRNRRDNEVLIARYTHSRNRGIFRECYPGNDTKFLENLQSYDGDVYDRHCFRIYFEIPNERGQDWSDDFIARIHLVRCWLAFFVIALAVFLCAYVFGLLVCCWRQSKWAYIAGLCAYIAAFSTAAAIAFFHGAEYLERNKITQEDPRMGKFYIAWDATTQNATTRTYGYSYIVGWIGMGLGAIAATMYCIAGCQIGAEDLKDKQTQKATDRSYGYSYIIGWIAMVLAAFTATFYSVAGCYIGGERYSDKDYPEKGRSREYLERSYPMPLEPPHKEYYYGYPANYGYQAQGPYLYDMDSRQPLPAIQYGPEPAAGQWRWQ
ncbi:hypothetical protein ACF0H5_000244 [Mactra antiquata]